MQRWIRWLRFNWRYFGQPPWDTGVSPPELLEFIAAHPAGRALDLGCGTGTNLLTLAKAGWQVTGVDFALRAVRDARRKLRAAGCAGEAHLGDVTRLDGIVGPFDLILDIGCYHGLTAQGRTDYRESVCRKLAPGGHFLLYAHLTGDETARVGISEREIGAFEARLERVKRVDSLDRWGRTALWMTFRQMEQR